MMEWAQGRLGLNSNETIVLVASASLAVSGLSISLVCYGNQDDAGFQRDPSRAESKGRGRGFSPFSIILTSQYWPEIESVTGDIQGKCSH